MPIGGEDQSAMMAVTDTTATSTNTAQGTGGVVSSIAAKGGTCKDVPIRTSISSTEAAPIPNRNTPVVAPNAIPTIPAQPAAATIQTTATAATAAVSTRSTISVTTSASASISSSNNNGTQQTSRSSTTQPSLFRPASKSRSKSAKSAKSRAIPTSKPASSAASKSSTTPANTGKRKQRSKKDGATRKRQGTVDASPADVERKKRKRAVNLGAGTSMLTMFEALTTVLLNTLGQRTCSLADLRLLTQQTCRGWNIPASQLFGDLQVALSVFKVIGLIKVEISDDYNGRADSSSSSRHPSIQRPGRVVHPFCGAIPRDAAAALRLAQRTAFRVLYLKYGVWGVQLGLEWWANQAEHIHMRIGRWRNANMSASTSASAGASGGTAGLTNPERNAATWAPAVAAAKLKNSASTSNNNTANMTPIPTALSPQQQQPQHHQPSVKTSIASNAQRIALGDFNPLNLEELDMLALVRVADWPQIYRRAQECGSKVETLRRLGQLVARRMASAAAVISGTSFGVSNSYTSGVSTSVATLTGLIPKLERLRNIGYTHPKNSAPDMSVLSTPTSSGSKRPSPSRSCGAASGSGTPKIIPPNERQILVSVHKTQDRVLASVDHFVSRITDLRMDKACLLSEEEILLRHLCAKAGVPLTQADNPDATASSTPTNSGITSLSSDTLGAEGPLDPIRTVPLAGVMGHFNARQLLLPGSPRLLPPELEGTTPIAATGSAGATAMHGIGGLVYRPQQQHYQTQQQHQYHMVSPTAMSLAEESKARVAERRVREVQRILMKKKRHPAYTDKTPKGGASGSRSHVIHEVVSVSGNSKKKKIAGPTRTASSSSIKVGGKRKGSVSTPGAGGIGSSPVTPGVPMMPVHMFASPGLFGSPVTPHKHARTNGIALGNAGLGSSSSAYMARGMPGGGLFGMGVAGNSFGGGGVGISGGGGGPRNKKQPRMVGPNNIVPPLSVAVIGGEFEMDTYSIPFHTVCDEVLVPLVPVIASLPTVPPTSAATEVAPPHPVISENGSTSNAMTVNADVGHNGAAIAGSSVASVDASAYVTGDMSTSSPTYPSPRIVTPPNASGSSEIVCNPNENGNAIASGHNVSGHGQQPREQVTDSTVFGTTTVAGIGNAATSIKPAHVVIPTWHDLNTDDESEESDDGVIENGVENVEEKQKKNELDDLSDATMLERHNRALLRVKVEWESVLEERKRLEAEKKEKRDQSRQDTLKAKSPRVNKRSKSGGFAVIGGAMAATAAVASANAIIGNAPIIIPGMIGGSSNNNTRNRSATKSAAKQPLNSVTRNRTRKRRNETNVQTVTASAATSADTTGHSGMDVDNTGATVASNGDVSVDVAHGTPSPTATPNGRSKRTPRRREQQTVHAAPVTATPSRGRGRGRPRGRGRGRGPGRPRGSRGRGRGGLGLTPTRPSAVDCYDSEANSTQARRSRTRTRRGSLSSENNADVDVGVNGDGEAGRNSPARRSSSPAKRSSSPAKKSTSPSRKSSAGSVNSVAMSMSGSTGSRTPTGSVNGSVNGSSSSVRKSRRVRSVRKNFD